MPSPYSNASVFLYDTTLRDGAQTRGISFSKNDKLKIARLLNEFGMRWIEGGWPGSNPKDSEFFKAARKQRIGRLVAFGSTRRKGVKAREDANIQALLTAETPSVALVGKSWTLHVDKVLEVSRNENLDMIVESVSLLKSEGKEVIFDAEHFFDGFRADQRYALSVLKAALDAGADWLCLCDTNGGMLPDFVSAVTKSVQQFCTGISDRAFGLGIHAHNDSELAVANSLAGVTSGCTQVQGTVNGYGERCGNANLLTIAANLELKMGRPCVGREALTKLKALAVSVGELANMSVDAKTPYVGAGAFAHKGGIHVSAVEKTTHSYEHVAPELVGNHREVLVSELSGRGNVRRRALESGLCCEGKEEKVLKELKELEARGLQFEGATASFELLVLRSDDGFVPPFEISEAMVFSARQNSAQSEVQAVCKVRVNASLMHTAAAGSGPVHALDGALRKALLPSYPALNAMQLTDFKVRILDPEHATAARTRVTIEAGDGTGNSWCTVGCSENLIDASLAALADSFSYFLLRVAKDRTVSTQIEGLQEPVNVAK